MTARALRIAVAVTLAVAGTALVGTPGQAARPGDAHRFDTWVGYDVGRYPGSVATGDFNGDGAPDVAWGRDDFFDNALSVTLNIGDGTLGAPQSYSVVEETTAVVAADLDDDQDLDLAVAGKGVSQQNGTIDLLLNDGAGNFLHTTATGGIGPRALAVEDVNDDEVLDLMVPDSGLYDQDDPSRGSVSVLIGDGDGSYADAVSYATGFRPSDVAVADFDGDGVVDIVSARQGEQGSQYAFELLAGVGDGTFVSDDDPQFITIPTNGGVNGPQLASGDVSGDQVPDLVVGGVATFNDAVLVNDGSGSFTATLYDVFGALDPHLADLDDDGDLDVVSAGGGGGTAGGGYIQRNNGDGTLAEAEQIRTSRNPLGVGIADLDGDHRPDVLIASRDTGTGVVHLQRPSGSFSSPPLGNQFEPALDVAAADLDGDLDNDIAATGVRDFLGVIRILTNDGTGGLTQTQTLQWDDQLNRNGRSVRVGDIDGDTDIDLAWMVNQGSSQRVLTSLNDGTGHFADPVPLTMPTCSARLTLADADGDGALDLVVAADEFGCGEGDAVSIRFNNGDGTFGAPTVLTMSWRTQSVVVADVDGDDIPDLIGGGQELPDRGNLAVVRGSGNRTFDDPEYLSTGVDLRELVAADLDGDGDPDVAAVSIFDEGTDVLINDGTGDFSSTVLPGEEITGYFNAVSIAVGDVNGDSIADLVIANTTGSDVGIHAGNGDGTFESQVRYGMRPVVTDVEVADLDGDGLGDIVSTASVPPDGAAIDGTDKRRSGGVTVLLSQRPTCTIVGTSGPDHLTGTRKADVICGFGGNDELHGLGSGDILLGGGGDDTLIGDPGDDVILGGTGDDRVFGGNGSDRLRAGTGADSVSGGPGVDVVDGLDHGQVRDSVDGGPGADHCRADEADIVIRCPATP